MKRYKVVLTDNAVLDLGDLYLHIAQSDSVNRAEYVFNKIVKAANSLEYNPERGNNPGELAKIGSMQFREIFFKPYRLFYSIEPGTVTVHLIVDGRRKLEDLLHKRLVNP